ncbi:hypothetical protein LTR50_007473 [Elasticomyces elasticus]|nr:hypothetical protein LTR50_007473 [Elasticomyces elasticus]
MLKRLAAKEQETQNKQLRSQDRAAQKAHEELEAQQKREDRAARAVARKAEEALKKVQKDKQKEAKKAQKQLETESEALNRKPRGRLARQKVISQSQEVVEPSGNQHTVVNTK